MNWNRVLRSLLPILLLPVALPGCASDAASPAPTSPRDFRGVWEVDGEVVSKKTCSRDVGDLEVWEVTIAQDGERGLVSLGGAPQELSIKGSRATANWSEESDIELVLDIAGDELTGSITSTDTSGAVPCEEVFTLSGMRVGAAPSAGFAGDWDLETSVALSSCEGEVEGITEQLCRRIEVDGSGITLLDPDGDLIGVIDGDTATLWRLGTETTLSAQIIAGSGGISGTVVEERNAESCSVNLAVYGTLREMPCVEPAGARSLGGS